MGACLTRVCMRQRSIENRLRSLADALTDELALSIQNKGSQWKQRISEMDRHANKFCRKVCCPIQLLLDHVWIGRLFLVNFSLCDLLKASINNCFFRTVFNTVALTLLKLEDFNSLQNFRVLYSSP